MAARDRIRSFFQTNVRRIVSTHEVAEVAGIAAYARRIRELRDEEGMQISSHKDRHDLKSGQYRLESLDLLPAVDRAVSPQLRMQILERNGFTCQLCWAGAGDPDPANPRRRIRLHIDHIVPVSQGGNAEPENLRALCSPCNQGRTNLQTPSEDAKNLLARIRKQPRSVQSEVYERLKLFFGD